MSTATDPSKEPPSKSVVLDVNPERFFHRKILKIFGEKWGVRVVIIFTLGEYLGLFGLLYLIGDWGVSKYCENSANALSHATVCSESFVKLTSEFQGKLRSPRNNNLLIPAIEMGHSGIIFHSGDPRMATTMPFLEDAGLKVEFEKGELLFSVKLRDPDGNMIGEIKRNEWHVKEPDILDRNYDASALEVTDKRADGEVLLQLEYLEDRLRLQGTLWRSDGLGITIAGDLMPGYGVFQVVDKTMKKRLSIRKLFKYPSKLHLTERDPYKFPQRNFTFVHQTPAPIKTP
jgi:hypothetical protein